MKGGDDVREFEEAFDPLYRRALLVGRRILGDAASAEDAAAEALARAYAHWPKIADEPWCEGWVVRVTTNVALDISRKRRRVDHRPPADRGVEDDDVAVRVALVAALAKLPRRQREVVALRHLSGLSEAETAEVLRVSAGSVKTHLHRGIASLRKVLGDEPALAEVTNGV